MQKIKDVSGWLGAAIKESGIPKWLWVLIGIGVATPIVLLVALLLSSDPVTDAEREAAVAAEEAKAIRARDEAEAKARQEEDRRIAAREELTSSFTVADGLRIGILPGGVGLFIGLLVLVFTSGTRTYDAYTGTKIGGKAVTQETTETVFSNVGCLSVLLMPILGYLLGVSIYWVTFAVKWISA